MQLMIDIEMLSPVPEGHILQISAIAFDFGFRPQEAMELLANTDRCFNIAFNYYGGEVNPETQAFWSLPEQQAAAELIEAMPKIELHVGLQQLAAFIKSFLGNRANIWAKPPLFDLEVLRQAYWRTIPEIDVPWKRSQEGCCRTLSWLADRVPRNKYRMPDDQSQGLVKHYALHDCVRQVILAQGGYRALVENSRDK